MAETTLAILTMEIAGADNLSSQRLAQFGRIAANLVNELSGSLLEQSERHQVVLFDQGPVAELAVRAATIIHAKVQALHTLLEPSERASWRMGIAAGDATRLESIFVRSYWLLQVAGGDQLFVDSATCAALSPEWVCQDVTGKTDRFSILRVLRAGQEETPVNRRRRESPGDDKAEAPKPLPPEEEPAPEPPGGAIDRKSEGSGMPGGPVELEGRDDDDGSKLTSEEEVEDGDYEAKKEEKPLAPPPPARQPSTGAESEKSTAPPAKPDDLLTRSLHPPLDKIGLVIPKKQLATVQFSAFYPREAAAETRHSLIIYAHLPEQLAQITGDVARFSDELGGTVPVPRHARTLVAIRSGSPITVIPESDELDFEPRQLMKRWPEDWTRFAFGFRPRQAQAGEAALIRVSIQVAGIEMAHINCAIDLTAPLPDGAISASANPLAAAKWQSITTTPYQRIFISYSRKDSNVARAYKLAQTALGNEVFLDVDNIRAGENWQAALARAIDEADIFQLFWSPHSAASQYCRYEWDYALRFKCPDTRCAAFIRPVFWEEPMPAPPEELGHLNFRYVPLAVGIG